MKTCSGAVAASEGGVLTTRSAQRHPGERTQQRKVHVEPNMGRCMSNQTWEGTCRTQHRKVDVRLPGKGSSSSHGARPVHLIITMMIPVGCQ